MASQSGRTQAQVTLVGEGVVFEGMVQAEEDFRAHGHIIGTLKVEGKVLVAEEGVVEGDIITTDAEIAGEVQGEIRVEDTLVLKSTARIGGTIETDRLVVEEGAQFTGECAMDTPIPESTGPAGGAERQNGEVRQDDKEDDKEAPEHDNEAPEPELSEELPEELSEEVAVA